MIHIKHITCTLMHINRYYDGQMNAFRPRSLKHDILQLLLVS